VATLGSEILREPEPATGTRLDSFLKSGVGVESGAAAPEPTGSREPRLRSRLGVGSRESLGQGSLVVKTE